MNRTIWSIGLTLTLALAGCSLLGTADTLAALGHQSCEPIPCGTGGSISMCTSTDGAGVCSGISYAVDGQTFDCPSCSNCGQAEVQAIQACQQVHGGQADGGTTDGGSGGLFPSLDSGGGSTNCAASQPCNGSTTYQVCTTTGSGGACSEIVLATSSGEKFACSGCNCDAAMNELAQYCNGSSGTSQTTCSAPESCGATGLTSQICTTMTNGVCTQIAYETSSGEQFPCNGCNDCTAAASDLAAYCKPGGTGGTTCGSSVACGATGVTYDACTTTDGTGACSAIQFRTSDGRSFTCASCADCTQATTELSSYCAGLSGGGSCGATTCQGGESCCNCSGTLVCYDLAGSTCADFGCQ